MLDDLLAQIAATPAPEGYRDRLIFLGDYIDRGPDPAGVLDRICEYRAARPDTIAIKGNHEELARKFLTTGDLRALSIWMLNGGDTTLASYDIAPPSDLADADEAARCRDALDAALPAGHRHLIQNAPPLARYGDYVFVHAGVRPGVPLDAQREEELIWIREPFLTSAEDFGARIVHGHSPAPAPEPHDNRVGLDTGAGKGGYLTAGLFWDTEIAFLHAYS